MSGNRVFVESLTHKVTAEETEWEDTDQGTDDDTNDKVILSDEEQEDGNEFGDSNLMLSNVDTPPMTLGNLLVKIRIRVIICYKKMIATRHDR